MAKATATARKSRIGDNVGLLSGTLKDVVATHETEVIAFVRVFNALGDNDKSRLQTIGSWKDIPAGAKKADMPQDNGHDWFLVNVLGQTAYGQDLIRASILPADVKPTVLQTEAANRAKADIAYALKVIRQVCRVGKQAIALEAKGMSVRLQPMNGVKTYQPIEVTSKVGKLTDHIWYSAPDFLRLRPETLKAGAKVSDLEATKEKRKPQQKGSGTQGQKAGNETPTVTAFKSWQKEIVPAIQSVAVAMHPETLASIAPAIAREGLSPKSADYDDLYAMFNVVGHFLTAKDAALTAAFDALMAKLPKPATTDKPAPKPDTKGAAKAETKAIAPVA